MRILKLEKLVKLCSDTLTHDLTQLKRLHCDPETWFQLRNALIIALSSHTSGNVICCRLLWNVQPRAVEIYPHDGSVICSIGHSGRHYVHYWFNSITRQVSINHSSDVTIIEN